MQLPAYWLPRPEFRLDAPTLERLEALYQTSIAPGKGKWVDELPVPAWQFLSWLVESKNHLLHGTGDPEIERFEPCQSNDAGEFGNRKAVYAASDGIWPMFFAVINRTKYHMGIINAAVELEWPDGTRTQPYYYFSVTDHVLAQEPWREGVVYVLPREGFEEEPARERDGMRIQTNHWASLEPVRPLAKLRVRPEDFPFLRQIRPHDQERLWQRIEADPGGFPWLD